LETLTLVGGEVRESVLYQRPLIVIEQVLRTNLNLNSSLALRARLRGCEILALFDFLELHFALLFII
jgi:hypothetical protein